MATSLMPPARQRGWTNNGAPAAGCKLYTYEAGTSTPKATYQDAAGTVEHENPITLDAKGEALIYWDGNYKIDLRTAAGAQVTGYPVDDFQTPVMPDSLVGSDGADLVGFDYSASYDPASLGGWLKGLATPVGASVLGFQQGGGTGAVTMTVQDMLRGIIDPRQYGVTFDGTTDDTAAWQLAINSRGAGKPVSIRVPSGFESSKVAGTLLIPPLCTINLNGCVLIGAGTNTMFESGYWASGVVASNHAQANESQIVYSTAIFNGQISNCDRAFKLFNFCESSRVEDIRFTSTNQAIYAKRCFYGSFRKLISRSPLNVATYPCYHLSDAVNAIGLDQVYAVGYNVGWMVDGVKDNFSATNCGAESCGIGIQVDNSSSGLRFDNWYFENVTSAIVLSSGGNHSNVEVCNCFFNSVTTAITGTTVVSGLFARTNRVNGAAVTLPTNFSNQLMIEIPTDTTGDNAVAALPANYSVGDTVTVDYVKTVYSTITGLAAAKARVHGGIIPFAYAGDSGTAITNSIPFCVCTLAPTSLTIDTKINYRDGAFIGIQLSIVATGLQLVKGLFIGDTQMAISKPGSITVTASNNAGFVRFVITGLVDATSYSGVVRHL